jgi:hypothetical protein
MNIELGLFLTVIFVILAGVALLNDSPPHIRSIRVK